MTDEAWGWEEARWRDVVGRVRAGRPLRPDRWKDGARCAVALSFDADHETSELRGGGTSVGRLAWGEFGARVGVPKILRVLAEREIPATFFVPAVAALLHPAQQLEVIAAGHEIGLHGWIHELNSGLEYEVERDLLQRSAETLEQLVGVRPVGLRTPSWDFSPHTLRIEQELGLEYDSSLMADEDCYELLADGEPTGIVELPVEWIRDDAVYLAMDRFGGIRPHTPPHEVLAIFACEFDRAYADGGVFQLTLHPHVIAYRSRIGILEDLIDHIRGHDDVWFATHRDVAAWARRHAA
ncbi:MAG: polysaccharide deacetylase [Solirubrobacterales bacterium]|nr:polysaccharide deacetylase [Solirubrobacterales bacterium]